LPLHSHTDEVLFSMLSRVSQVSHDSERKGLNQHFYFRGKKYLASELIRRKSTFQETTENYFSTRQRKAKVSSEEPSPNSSYSNNKKGSRKALLLNNFRFKTKGVDITGGAHDTANLYVALNSLGWEVETADNTTEVQMEKVIKNFIESLTKETSAILVFISSHGERRQNQDYFFTADGKPQKLNKTIDKFSETNFPKLAGKPKIFLTDFCRIDSEAKALTKKDEYSPTKPEDRTNMLIAYGTQPGRASYAYDEGSWFIKVFTEALQTEEQKMTTEKEQLKEGTEPDKNNKPLSLVEILDVVNDSAVLGDKTAVQLSTFDRNPNFEHFYF